LSPAFDFSNITSKTVFAAYLFWNSETTYDGTILQYTVTEGRTWVTIGAKGDATNWYTTAGVKSIGGDAWSGTTQTNYTLVAHILPTQLYQQPRVHFRFYFASDNSVNYDGIAVDDVSIFQPTTPPRCALLNPANITGSYVRLSWTQDPTDTAILDGYKLYIGTSNPPTTLVYNGTVASYTGGFKPGTIYYWLVIPTSFGLDAVGCSATTFTTPTYPVASFPYFENFEAGNGNWRSSGSINSWALGTPNKAVIKGAYSGVNTWVTGNLTGQYPLNEISFLTSPAFDFTSVASQAYISFYLWYDTEKGVSTGTPYDGLSIQYTTDYGSTWTTLGLVGDKTNWFTDNNVRALTTPGWSGHSGGYYLSAHLLPLTLNGQSDVRFRFQFGSDFSTNFDGVAIDDISLQLLPANTVPLCSTPVPVTSSNPATITWKRNAQDSPFQPDGYLLYFGATPSPTSLVYNGTGLSFTTSLLHPSTTFYYQVVPYSVGGKPSCPVQSFVTPTEPSFPFPYFQDFESGPSGWFAGGAISDWVLTSPDKLTIKRAFSGSAAWVTNDTTTYSLNEASFVTSPIIDFTGISTDPYISLRVWWDSEGSYDGALVQVLTSSSWVTIGNKTSGGVNWYNDNSVNALAFADPALNGWSGHNFTSNGGSRGWLLASHLVPGVAGKFAKFRIAFGSDDLVVYDGFAFDDVALQTTPSWSPPPATTAPVPTTRVATPTTVQTSRYIPPTPTTSPVNTQENVGKQSSGSPRNNVVLAAVLIPILVVLVLAIIALLVYFLVIKKRKQGTSYKLEAAAHELSEVERTRH